MGIFENKLIFQIGQIIKRCNEDLKKDTIQTRDSYYQIKAFHYDSIEKIVRKAALEEEQNATAGREEMNRKQKYEKTVLIPEGSQAYILANLPEGQQEGIVIFKGNTRKLITLYAFAGAKVAERLKADGYKDIQIRDALIGTFTTAIDAALKEKKERKESNHEES